MRWLRAKDSRRCPAAAREWPINPCAARVSFANRARAAAGPSRALVIDFIVGRDAVVDGGEAGAQVEAGLIVAKQRNGKDAKLLP